MIKETIRESVEDFTRADNNVILYLLFVILIGSLASSISTVSGIILTNELSLFLQIIVILTIIVTIFIIKMRDKLNRNEIKNTIDSRKLKDQFKGLIAFISEPPKKLVDEPESKMRWIATNKEIIKQFAATKNSTQVVDIQGIGPIFKAIIHNSEKLNHCWLIHSKQSAINIELINYFFKEVLNNNIKPEFIEIGNPDNCKLINEVVNNIYDKLPKGITEKDVISDITSGNKPMTTGMIISCLPPQRRIEYVEQREKELIEIEINGRVENFTVRA